MRYFLRTLLIVLTNFPLSLQKDSMSHVARMNISLIVLVLAGCPLTVPAAAIGADSLALTAADESAVRKVVADFADTWNRHDMKAMHELNTDDVEWINGTANHWRGNPMVSRGHTNIHRTVFAKTEMVVDKMLVRSIAPQVAIVVAAMKFSPVTYPSGEVIPELRTRGSFTLVKRGDAWKFVHFQNTVIDAEAEKNDPATWDETGFLPGKK